MRIEREVRLVHCGDGRIKKEYELSGPVSREFTGSCRPFGEVRIIEGLKKPFFTFLIPDRLNIKGFIGEPVIEAWFFPAYVVSGEQFLVRLFSGYGDNGSRAVIDEEYRRLLEPE